MQQERNSSLWLFYLLFAMTGEVITGSWSIARSDRSPQAAQHWSSVAVWFRVRLPVISSASITSLCDMVRTVNTLILEFNCIDCDAGKVTTSKFPIPKPPAKVWCRGNRIWVEHCLRMQTVFWDKDSPTVSTDGLYTMLSIHRNHQHSPLRHAPLHGTSIRACVQVIVVMINQWWLQIQS